MIHALGNKYAVLKVSAFTGVYLPDVYLTVNSVNGEMKYMQIIEAVMACWQVDLILVHIMDIQESWFFISSLSDWSFLKKFQEYQLLINLSLCQTAEWFLMWNPHQKEYLAASWLKTVQSGTIILGIVKNNPVRSPPIDGPMRDQLARFTYKSPVSLAQFL